MYTNSDPSVWSQLLQMRAIIGNTIRLMLDRHASHTSYGWIDLKIDAIDGTDCFDIPGIRDRNHVYSWIQGRGLEALAIHGQWFGKFSGIPTPDMNRLKTLAETVARSLQQARGSHQGHLVFCMDESGHGSYTYDGRFTMSDLFCSRGLYAYYRLHGTPGQTQEAKHYVKHVVKAIIAGNFINDQQTFAASTYRDYRDGRKSYAGEMLALGAVTLLVKLDHDGEALALGRQLIAQVVDTHVNSAHRWPFLKDHAVVEWIGRDGHPCRNDQGYIQLDPGHALEFIGLCAQFLLACREYGPSDAESHEWIDGLAALLPSLLEVNLAYGYHSSGGILKSVDGERGLPLHDSMPWWSLPETMRALASVEKLCGSDTWSDWSRMWFDLCFEAFERNFYSVSAIPVAVQCINLEGHPIPVIPATPDLDPGYHTGLSLIACYDLLAEQVPVQFSGTEVDITPELGVRLSGHVARSRPAQAVLDRLHARICLLQEPYGAVGLISVDVLEFSPQWISSVREQISKIWDISPHHMLLVATHTHTAPPVIQLGTLAPDDVYVQFMTRQILDGCRAVVGRYEPVVLEVAECSSDVGINRRFHDRDLGKTFMRPNREGSRDDEVLVVGVRDWSGVIRAILCNIAVHPTTLGVGLPVVSADYPGRIEQVLKRRFGERLVVVPLIGACGDVRPALLDENQQDFREGTEEDIIAIGERVGALICDALEHAQPLVPGSAGVSLCLASRQVVFDLHQVPTRTSLHELIQANAYRYQQALAQQAGQDPFSKLHDNPLWAVEMERQWADALLAEEEIPHTIVGEFSVLCIGDQILLFAIPGELFSAVGKRVKRLGGGRFSLLAGYAGGSLGYLPSRTAIAEGGYEVTDAYKYYGISGSFGEELEGQILRNFDELLHSTVCR